MSRPIKFRVWDGGRKKMHYLGFIMHISGAGLEEHAHESTEAEGPLELMQFTGLHDADGKEIYEGDILRSSRAYKKDEFDYLYYEGIGYVEWGSAAYGGKPGWDLLMPDGEPAQKYYGFADWHLCRVIGNIYENPDLLDG